ncbi:MAG: HD domain-containing phosphohydrolase [Lentisphaerota bacterium]
MDAEQSEQPTSDAHALLIVEPGAEARGRLAALFAGDAYVLHQAITGPQALAMASLGTPDLILLGSGLTEPQRTDVCRQIRIDPLLKDMPIISIVSDGDVSVRLRILEAGADDVFSEPIHADEVNLRVRHILRQDRPNKLTAQRLEYERVQGEMETALDAILEKWAFSQEMIGVETVGHTRRVVDLTLAVARQMQIPEQEFPMIRRGALLHDIGRVAVDQDDVLAWSALSPGDQARVRQHPVRAEELLWPIPILRQALAIPLHHHERWDGSGYPNGLTGEAIPLAARIFAVVDVYDELCAGHPKRPAWQPHLALAMIRTQSGKWFDPAVVDAFLKVQPLQPAPVPSTSRKSVKRKRAERPHKLLDRISLSRRGAWAQLVVASLLITVLPMLCLIWLWQADVNGLLTSSVAAGVSVVTIVIMLAGYTLLGKYPLNIVRMRNYLQMLASGDMPVRVHLSNDTDDLTAMQQYMADIVRQAADRIRVIQEQQERLLHTERQRVMIESLGSLCHHLGQPATRIAAHLYILQQQVEKPEMKKTVEECQQAFDALRDILTRLQRIVVYRTEPYLNAPSEDPSHSDTKIISV